MSCYRPSYSELRCILGGDANTHLEANSSTNVLKLSRGLSEIGMHFLFSEKQLILGVFLSFLTPCSLHYAYKCRKLRARLFKVAEKMTTKCGQLHFLQFSKCLCVYCLLGYCFPTSYTYGFFIHLGFILCKWYKVMCCMLSEKWCTVLVV